MNENHQPKASVIEKTLRIRTISDLLDEKFIVPRYQRGYRWGKQEVTELLDDIFDYAELNRPEKKAALSPGKFYCLQPIVVKKNEKNGDTWDLIDGQQRLTTLFVILTYLKNIRDGKENVYSINFETRSEKCDDFLGKKQFIDKIDESNVDFYHISKCYEYTKNWFNDDDDLKKQILQILLNPEDRPNVSVIWYEVKDVDPIDIFTRLNIEKIPLTDAELIKAMLLQSDRYPEDRKKYAKQRLREIASEWDEITAGFQNENMWYFLNNSGNNYISRIELIFNILAEKWNEKLNPKIETDIKHFSYLVFHHYIEQKRGDAYSHHQIKTVNAIWKDIKKIYTLFMEWYNDRKMYHYIGYLIATKDVRLRKLLKLSQNSTKDIFVEKLKAQIGNKIKISKKDDNNKIKTLEELAYGKDNSEIIRILLLFNVETIVKDGKPEEVRFPFYLYKKNRIWSIEHIHPQNPEEISKNEDKAKKWLSSHLEALEKLPDGQKEKCKDLIAAIKTLLNAYNKNKFEEIFDLYNKLAGIKEGEKHTLYNLALVDRSTNSTLNNSFFDKKRSLIREIAKESYVPICTQRVFEKYYTDYPTDMVFWSDIDRTGYFGEIEKVYNYFINLSKTGEKQ